MRNLTRAVACIAATFALWPLAAGLPGLKTEAAAQDAGPKIVETTRWRAWVDAMPGPGRQAHPIYVTGEVVLSRPGYKVTLVRANPREARAPILVLDLVIERERPPDAEVLTLYTPRFVDETPPRRYAGVAIRYDGKTIQTLERIDTIR
jgi:hypothetical protein